MNHDNSQVESGAEQPTEAMVAPQPAGFTVVGIGASAGGLAALRRFFEEMPAESGMAFVVVVHLHPEYESHLAELLQRHTAMPVRQVMETVAVEPNSVYVIPPNRNLTSIDTHLRLSQLETRAKRAPIDHFFRTLAETHGEKAVGIVLSGTGADGTVGLRHIKEQGGLTVAQEPSDAEYDGMPQSAIATGQVDSVLPVEAIPAKLVEYLELKPHLTIPADGELLAVNEREVLRRILASVQAQTGYDFSAYKPATLLRRLRRRMQMRQIEETSRYLSLLREDEKEARLLLRDWLITVTSFFRDPEALARVEEVAIPQLFMDKGPSDQVRVWVVGCATGEEAYSLAILLLEYAAKLERPPAIQLFASDISGEALNRAKEGRYPETIAADISLERLERFFVKEGSSYQVKKVVREIVLFADHNLLRDPPFSRVDLISCRNLLIYLKREVQRQVFESFHYALRPQGYLLLGPAESVEGGELFQVLSKKQSLFQRNNRPHRLPVLPLRPLEIPESLEGVALPNRQGGDFVGERGGVRHQQMVERFAPPSAVVDADYHIVHLSENAGRYLRLPGGEVTSHILKNVREELRLELTAGLYTAFEEKRMARTKPIPLMLEGMARQVSLNIRPATSRELQGLVLVIFEEENETDGEVVERGSATRQLEEQLAQWPKRLQRAIEEFDNSKEEMQAANEELLSVNEELRSTAEELETSKEELQSMNEELVTVNQENRHKMEELAELNSDLQNLLVATNIATLFLDRQLRIKRFTPKIGELFNMIAADQGRPLAHLTHRLGYTDLVEDAAEVLRALTPIEREIRSEGGQWQLTRLLPYRTVDDHIDGVVITFVDITLLKQAEEVLRQNEQQLQTLNEELEKRVERRTADVRRLAAEVLVVEQKTQQQISKVLHDDLQQLLFSMQMEMGLLSRQLAEGEGDLPAQVAEVRNILEEAIQTARQVAHNVAPPVLHNEDFGDSLRWLASYMKERYGLAVETEVALPLGRPSEEARIFIFQTVRELLFNVVKHAGANQAHVKMFEEDGSLKIVVADNGRGFDTTAWKANESPIPTGLGLSGIRNRLRLLGGELVLESEADKGTVVTMTF